MSDKVLVLQVGTTPIVAGLSWRALGTDPRGETQATARMLGARYGLLLRSGDGRLLSGFLSALAPSRARRAVSGAVWLTNTVTAPTIYLRGFPSGEFWLVAAEPGNLDVRTDRIAHDDEIAQVLDMLLSENSNAEPDKKYHVVVEGDRRPSGHMFTRYEAEGDTSTGTLAELLKGSTPTKSERVTQIIGIKPAQVIAVAAVVALCFLGWATYHWVQHQREQAQFEANRAAMEHQRLVAEQLKNEAQLRMAQAVVQALAQDTATPPPEQVLKNCMTTLRAAGNDLGGWRLTHVDCATNGAGATMTYALDDVSAGGLGTNATLMDAAKTKYNVTPAIDVASGRATVAIPGTPLPNRVGLTPIEAPPYQQVMREFVTRMQLIRDSYQSVSYTLSTPQPKNVTYLDPAQENSSNPSRFVKVPADRTYLIGNMNVTGTGLWELDGFALDWRFLTIHKVELIPSGSDADNYQWRVEGVYVSARQ